MRLSLRNPDLIAAGVLFSLLVAILLLALLGGRTGGTPLPPPVSERELAIAVEILPEPPPQKPPEPPPPPPAPPKPEPPPPEPPKPEPTPTPTRQEPAPAIDSAAAADEAAPGALPPLQADYRQFVGFRRYAEEMQRAGADFFLAGTGRKSLLQIDFSTRSLTPTAIATVAARGYSPRTRVICDEPALQEFLQLARTQHGIEQPEVIMLIPAGLEEAIARRLHGTLQPRQIKLEEISVLRGHYELLNQRLILQIQSAQTPDGPIELACNIIITSRQ